MSKDKNLKPGWKVWRFDQMATNVNVRIDNPAESGMEHYVGLEHLDPDSLKIRRWGKPSDVEAGKLMFKKGDIIFAKRRAYQRKLGVAEFDGICSAHAMVLRAKPEVVLPEFLPFFMQSDVFMERAIEISVGSLSPTINWKTMAVQEFVLPTLFAQEKIVDICNSIEENILQIESANVAAMNLQRAMREKYFSENGKVVRLHDLIDDIQAGKSLSASDISPSTLQEKAVLKVSAVGARNFLPHESKILLDQNGFLAQHMVRNGDLLITRANTPDLVGLACLVDGDFPNLMLSDKTLRLIPKKGVPKRLLLECLRTNAARQYLKGNATGTGSAMKNISQGVLKSMQISFPEREDYLFLEQLFFDMDSSINSLALQLIRAQDFKNKLYKKIFCKFNE